MSMFTFAFLPTASALEASTFLAFGLPGGTEWIVIAVIGLLIFGRRLPEVGRSVGRSIVEFKKGIKGIEDEIEDASSGVSSLEDQSHHPGNLPLDQQHSVSQPGGKPANH